MGDGISWGFSISEVHIKTEKTEKMVQMKLPWVPMYDENIWWRVPGTSNITGSNQRAGCSYLSRVSKLQIQRNTRAEIMLKQLSIEVES